MTDPIHDWDGAYVLGALAPDERRRYDAHLAECSTCSRSVRELAGVPGIIGGLEREEALSLRDQPDDVRLRDGAHAPDRAAGVARRVRRRRTRVRLLPALVLVGVLGAGSAVGWAVLRGAAPAVQQAAAHEMRPVGASHLYADLRVTSVGWGTRLDWSCDYRAPAGETDAPARPVSYSLVVHTTTGGSTTVATWTSDAGEAKNLVASTAIPADSIRRVDIRVTGTQTALAQAAF